MEQPQCRENRSRLPLIPTFGHWWGCTFVSIYICPIGCLFYNSQGASLPIIALLKQEGGTGKTTLATNLACVFTVSGSVILLDADPQASARHWIDSRSQPPLDLEVIQPDPTGFLLQARTLPHTCHWLKIDNPPGITRISAQVVRATDLVSVPAKAGSFDVWVAADIVEAVEARQANPRGTPKAAFIITRTPPGKRPRTRLGWQVDQALADYDLPTLEARTTERVSYPQAAIEGLAVLETRGQTVRKEILAIRGETARIMNDDTRKTRPYQRRG